MKTYQMLYIKKIRENGVIFNLDEEGGVDFINNPTIKRRYSKTVFELCEHIFLWGEEQKKELSKNLIINQKNFSYWSSEV